MRNIIAPFIIVVAYILSLTDIISLTTQLVFTAFAIVLHVIIYNPEKQW